MDADPQIKVEGTLPLSPLLNSLFPPLPLEARLGPLNSGGALYSPPAESGAEPQSKLNLMQFSLKI